MYLIAIIDLFSRKILSWRISNTLDNWFCIRALEEALLKYGQPEIFNSDQGSQFTSEDFIKTLEDRGIDISMDGKGRALDNIFIERFWRSLKYENIYLNDYQTVPECRAGVKRYFRFYNTQRYHQSLDYKTPDEFYYEGFFFFRKGSLMESTPYLNEKLSRQGGAVPMMKKRAWLLVAFLSLGLVIWPVSPAGAGGREFIDGAKDFLDKTTSPARKHIGGIISNWKDGLKDKRQDLADRTNYSEEDSVRHHHPTVAC